MTFSLPRKRSTTEPHRRYEKCCGVNFNKSADIIKSMPKLVNSSRFIVHRILKTVNPADAQAMAGRREPITVNRRLWRQGFTLIEILLYLLLVLAMVTILFSASGTYITSRRSNLQSVAAKIASRDIETLRKSDFASLPGTGSFSDPDLSKLPSSTANRTITDYEGDSDIKKVEILIAWTEKGVAQQLKMDTLISKNGL